LTLAEERDCGYKGVQVSDPRAKHWLADDANFLATLGDLDRGLGGTSPDDDIPREEAANVTGRTHHAPPPAPRARVDSSSAAPIESRPGPLLDLFPESALVPESSASPSAAADLDLQPPGEGPGLVGRLLIVTAFALLVLVGAAGALWASRDAVNRTILQWEQVPLPPGGPVRRLSVPIAPIPPPDVDALR
jgi:hypothetical protein